VTDRPPAPRPKGIWGYVVGVLVALDILVAALAGAHHGETISHAAQRHRDTWGGPVCAMLDIPDPGHCARVTY
jgi:hypothetical protein